VLRFFFFFNRTFWHSPVVLDSVRLKAEDFDPDFHSDLKKKNPKPTKKNPKKQMTVKGVRKPCKA